MKRSAVRVAADPEFRYVTEDLERLKKRLAENHLSLNEKLRRSELDEDKARKEQRTAARAQLKAPDQKVFQLTLDNVGKPELQLAKVDVDADEDAEPAAEDGTGKQVIVDPVRNEALHIIADLAELSRTPKTASTK